jgi:hypothetical protein
MKAPLAKKDVVIEVGVTLRPKPMIFSIHRMMASPCRILHGYKVHGYMIDSIIYIYMVLRNIVLDRLFDIR